LGREQHGEQQDPAGHCASADDSAPREPEFVAVDWSARGEEVRVYWKQGVPVQVADTALASGLPVHIFADGKTLTKQEMSNTLTEKEWKKVEAALVKAGHSDPGDVWENFLLVLNLRMPEEDGVAVHPVAGILADVDGATHFVGVGAKACEKFLKADTTTYGRKLTHPNIDYQIKNAGWSVPSTAARPAKRARPPKPSQDSAKRSKSAADTDQGSTAASTSRPAKELDLCEGAMQDVYLMMGKMSKSQIHDTATRALALMSTLP